jgi:hypothetical protein
LLALARPRRRQRLKRALQLALAWRDDHLWVYSLATQAQLDLNNTALELLAADDRIILIAAANSALLEQLVTATNQQT